MVWREWVEGEYNIASHMVVDLCFDHYYMFNGSRYIIGGTKYVISTDYIKSNTI